MINSLHANGEIVENIAVKINKMLALKKIVPTRHKLVNSLLTQSPLSSWPAFLKLNVSDTLNKGSTLVPNHFVSVV